MFNSIQHGREDHFNIIGVNQFYLDYLEKFSGLSHCLMSSVSEEMVVFVGFLTIL